MKNIPTNLIIIIYDGVTLVVKLSLLIELLIKKRVINVGM